MTHATRPRNDSGPHIGPHTRVSPISQERVVVRAVLLGLASISVWRGVWLLSDLYLFPSNLALSGAVSVALGLLVFLFFAEVRL